MAFRVPLFHCAHEKAGPKARLYIKRSIFTTKAWPCSARRGFALLGDKRRQFPQFRLRGIRGIHRVCRWCALIWRILWRAINYDIRGGGNSGGFFTNAGAAGAARPWRSWRFCFLFFSNPLFGNFGNALFSTTFSTTGIFITANALLGPASALHWRCWGVGLPDNEIPVNPFPRTAIFTLFRSARLSSAGLLRPDALLGMRLILGGGNNPEIMLGMLQIILRRHRISRRVGVARQLHVFFRYVGGIAPHPNVRPVTLITAGKGVGTLAIIVATARTLVLLVWSHKLCVS